MYSSTLTSTSALDGGGWSMPHPSRFTPGKDPVPIVYEAGWAPGLVWTDAENLTPTGIRSPDRPARSESLYRLNYPGPYCTKYKCVIYAYGREPALHPVKWPSYTPQFVLAENTKYVDLITFAVIPRTSRSAHYRVDAGGSYCES